MKLKGRKQANRFLLDEYENGLILVVDEKTDNLKRIRGIRKSIQRKQSKELKERRKIKK